MIPFFRHGYKLDNQKGVFQQKEMLTSRECKKDILAFLDGDSAELDLHPRLQGGAIVDIYYKKGAAEAFARYFDYEEYSAGTEYPLRQISAEKMKMLASYF